jgi:hypothetical protein
MTRLVLRVIAAVCLGISAYVHLHLASRYGFPGTINGETIFRIQAVAAATIGVLLLTTGNKWVWLAAAALGVASFAAVMLYRYVNVGAIGPLPNMYDATWQPSPEKLLSAMAEIAVPILWLADTFLRKAALRQSTKSLARRRSPAPQPGGS